MREILVGIAALLCALIFASFGPAMQSTSPQPQEHLDQHNYIVVENLCDPDLSAESNQEWVSVALDYEQLERVRIELLERGFNPGFDPERNSGNDNQLREAVAQFQSEYHLPLTGQIDASTLAGLNIPIQKSGPTMSEQPTQRAKPSK
jgi:hypothetical protein